MVTVIRSNGFRVVIYLDDHAPAHVHVIGNGEAKVNLLSADGGPELVWAFAMKRNDVRRAMDLVADQLNFLLLKWNEIHG